MGRDSTPIETRHLRYSAAVSYRPPSNKAEMLHCILKLPHTVGDKKPDLTSLHLT